MPDSMISALVMTGVTNQLSKEGTNTVALFGADEGTVTIGHVSTRCSSRSPWPAS